MLIFSGSAVFSRWLLVLCASIMSSHPSNTLSWVTMENDSSGDDLSRDREWISSDDQPEVIDCFLYRFPSWLVCCPKGTLSIQSAAAGSVWNNNFWAVINVEINFWGKPGPTTKLDKRWFPGDYFDWLSITYQRGLLLSIQKQPTPAGWLQAEI